MKKIIIIYFSLLVFNQILLYPQWMQTNGPANGEVRSLAISDSLIFAGTANSNSSGVFISNNNGQNWSNSFNNKNIYSLAASGQYVFAGVFSAPDSVIYRSTNYGQSWSQSFNMYAFSFLVFNYGGMSYVYAGKNGIVLTTDNGVTWVNKSTWCSYIGSFAKSTNHIYEGTIILGCGVTMSTINGDSCRSIGLIGHDVFSLAVNNSYLFAGTGNGVYLTTNNGQNWTQTSLNNYAIFSLINYGNNIFAGTGGAGVYLSTNNGTNWIQCNQGLGNLTVRALIITTNYIFAGASDGFVYRRSINNILGTNLIRNETPYKFLLYQNYPNPFNPTTKIKFSIPFLPLVKGEAEGVNQVQLKIYNILGREVATLVNNKLSPGTYEVEWNGSNYASGVYFYKLVSGDFFETKKLILLK